jgi:hypothetical protein
MQGVHNSAVQEINVTGEARDHALLVQVSLPLKYSEMLCFPDILHVRQCCAALYCS